MSRTLSRPQSAIAPGTGLAIGAVRVTPTWHPVPAIKRASPAPNAARRVSRKPVLGVTVSGATIGEKLGFGLLALGATASIGYGVWCLLDLVQNWASFEVGIGRFLQ